MQQIQARPSIAVRGGLRRTLTFLRGQWRSATWAYGALVVATLAQLMVPQLVQNMINAVTNSLGPGMDRAAAESLIINSALLILLFAVLRGIFAFVQAFYGRNNIAGDRI